MQSTDDSCGGLTNTKNPTTVTVNNEVGSRGGGSAGVSGSSSGGTNPFKNQRYNSTNPQQRSQSNNSNASSTSPQSPPQQQSINSHHHLPSQNPTTPQTYTTGQHYSNNREPQIIGSPSENVNSDDNGGKPFRSWSATKNWMIRWRGSRQLVLVIVAIALLLDNMLLTTIVPIIPEFLYDIRHPDAPLDSFQRTPMSLSTPPPPTTPPPCSRLIPGAMGPTPDYETEIASTLSAAAENASYYEEREVRHKELVGETVEVGLMFASKAFVQLLVNPIVGPLTHRIGYSIPMFAGFVIMFLSTLIFAFGRSYSVLFLARALQGIGSSCSSVSGMGMLADRYTDDKERGNAMGIALGGLALGVLIGPPFGGFLYEFVGKSAPFLILSALALGDGLLQLFMLQPSIQHTDTDPPSLKALVSDPYIIIAAGSITFANMGIAMLEPSLPIWMMDNMGASRWEQGVTFLPASISYLIGTNLFGPLGHKIGRWLAALLGLVIIGVCLTLIPLATSINHLIIPNAGLGFAIGMVDSCMMPELGYLVDIRHSAVYGSVYALGDVAFCLGFAVGPALSGTLVNTIGFEWMLFGIAILCFLYAPLLTFLKNPPTKEEKKSLIIGERSSVRYVTYQNEDDDE